MFKQMVIAVCILASAHNMSAMQPKPNPFQCPSVALYKATLQDQIARKDWQAVQQTERNMQAFLDDASNKSCQRFRNQQRYKTKSTIYGATALLSILLIKSKTARVIGGLSAILTGHYVAARLLVTPENVYDPEKRWLAKTIRKVAPQLYEFQRENAGKGENVTRKHE